MMTLEEADASNYSPIFETLARVYDDEAKMSLGGETTGSRRSATMAHCAAFVRGIDCWECRIDGYYKLRDELSDLFSEDEAEHDNEDIADALLILDMFEDQYQGYAFYFDGSIVNRATGERM